MTGLLSPGLLVQATAITLQHEPTPTDQITAGTPTTGFVVLADGPPEIGVWEMTAGTATDVEVDEVFVVLAGRATLVIGSADPIELVPGSVVQLVAGMVTSWTVHETLRKIYVT